ncbi:hypothetical protein SAMN04487969_14228 [Paenibacillus algorifonticola]|uniref:ATP-grasp domain-containing protein n=1 Tax=Paenibacillus algorifonticola TaxID=684063 RepID=A0A1I2IU69_9BACL|nr:ATP-grasp domain-containing protein [Paenibacillus algorifonticola]SFF45844.1 hypothetical protein SAMN04487969_14228 [Paenibacillus algorifonticola]
MRIIYCADPLNPKKVDSYYEKEYEAAKTIGFNVSLINFEELQSNQTTRATRQISIQEQKEKALYRGWMMTGEVYFQLYNHLKNKNIELINNIDEYNFCHYTPNSYDVIKKITPLTVWLHKSEIEDSLDKVFDVVEVFGQGPIILKDYVKSRKHDWNEACFIPDASNKNKLLQVVKSFIELQGDELNEGLVFKAFVNLEFLSHHPQSGAPLSKEFRIFFLEGKPLITLEYWDEGVYGENKPELTPFIEIAKKINSHFFTMDIAKVENGSWVILELGDGQVSGLPNNADLIRFYNNIKLSNIQ